MGMGFRSQQFEYRFRESEPSTLKKIESPPQEIYCVEEAIKVFKNHFGYVIEINGWPLICAKNAEVDHEKQEVRIRLKYDPLLCISKEHVGVVVSEDKTYLLGLLAADANVSVEGGHTA